MLFSVSVYLCAYLSFFGFDRNFSVLDLSVLIMQTNFKMSFPVWNDLFPAFGDLIYFVILTVFQKLDFYDIKICVHFHGLQFKLILYRVV